MKRARLTLVVAVAVSLLAAIPALAQTSKAASAGELGIAITINKLELTPTQMQQVHDILAGVLSEANALKEKRDAFTQEMINFTGSSTDLDTALTNFKSQMKDQTQAFQENVKQALDKLKGILTVEQGEILRDSFLKGANFGLEGKLPVGMGPRAPGVKPGDQQAAQDQAQQGNNQPKDQQGNNQPKAQQGNNQPQAQQGNNQPQGQTNGRPSARFQALRDGRGMAGRPGAGDLLDTLQKIVDILEVKLQ